MVAIKDSGATRRGAGKSARPPPIRSRNVGKTPRRSASTPAVGTRPSRLGSARSPPSTLLRVSRTVGHRARWQDTPTAEEVQGIVRRPGYKDTVRLPAGMSSDVGGRERPDHLIVEMARVPGDSASTHVGEQLRDFQGQAPEFKGIVAGAMEMPQVRLMFCTAVPPPAARIGGSRPPGQAGLSGTKYSTWGRGYPRKHEAGGGGEMEGR